MQIYLARNNVQAGPYTLQQLNTMLASGEVELVDLAWHEELSGWKSLQELTGGKNYYNPLQNDEVSPVSDLNNDADNNQKLSVDELYGRKPSSDLNNDTDKNQRTSVDELYGRKPTNKETDIQRDADNTSKNNSKEQGDNKKFIRIKISEHPLKIADEKLPSVSSRVLASLIDWLIIAAIYMPLLSYIDETKLVLSEDFSEAMVQSRAIVESIPPEVASLTSIAILVFFLIQLVLLVTRGQSIGKLLTGIKIVDFKTHERASITNLLLLRVIITYVIYFAIAFPVLVAVDFVFMMFNQNKRSLHDKIAGTCVVKTTIEKEQKNEKTD